MTKIRTGSHHLANSKLELIECCVLQRCDGYFCERQPLRRTEVLRSFLSRPGLLCRPGVSRTWLAPRPLGSFRQGALRQPRQTRFLTLLHMREMAESEDSACQPASHPRAFGYSVFKEPFCPLSALAAPQTKQPMHNDPALGWAGWAPGARGSKPQAFNAESSTAVVGYFALVTSRGRT